MRDRPLVVKYGNPEREVHTTYGGYYDAASLTIRQNPEGADKPIYVRSINGSWNRWTILNLANTLALHLNEPEIQVDVFKLDPIVTTTE